MNYMKHFGEKSVEYRQFRPDYPNELYQYLSQMVTEHDLAWDCGTGNGQAAVKLADYFTEVIGSDINQAQLAAAITKKNIHYVCCSVEKTTLSDHTVDLITVAQALHWFPLNAFYDEVKRVAKKTGIIAAWSYSLVKVNHAIDQLITKLYEEILGTKYWPKERLYVDAEYKTIPFPFKQIKPPTFTIEKEMDLNQLIGFLSTWSAVKEYQKINQDNPINLIYPKLQKVWGEPEKVYTMRWAIHLLVGKISA